MASNGYLHQQCHANDIYLKQNKNRTRREENHNKILRIIIIMIWIYLESISFFSSNHHRSFPFYPCCPKHGHFKLIMKFHEYFCRTMANTHTQTHTHTCTRLRIKISDLHGMCTFCSALITIRRFFFVFFSLFIISIFQQKSKYIEYN